MTGFNFTLAGVAAVMFLFGYWAGRRERRMDK